MVEPDHTLELPVFFQPQQEQTVSTCRYNNIMISQLEEIVNNIF